MTDQSVDLYRLISETVTNDPHSVNGGVTYSFDGVGNRQTRNSTLAGVPAQTFTGAYDQSDRLTATGYTYDNDGNTLTDPAGNSYQYDSLDRMTQATVSGTTINYVYDGDGNRVSKTVNSVTTNYLVDTNSLTGYPQVVDELQGGNVVRTYTYGTSRISQDQFNGASWNMSFYGTDGQGSVRYLTDNTGSISDTYDYDSFGNAINKTGTTPNNYLYDGEQFDPDLGQYYLRARYMNPGIGRFQTMDMFEGDQFEPITLHKYLFGANNPVNYRDPSGRDFIGAATAGFAVAMAEIVFQSIVVKASTFENPGSDSGTEIYVRFRKLGGVLGLQYHHAYILLKNKTTKNFEYFAGFASGNGANGSSGLGASGLQGSSNQSGSGSQSQNRGVYGNLFGVYDPNFGPQDGPDNSVSPSFIMKVKNTTNNDGFYINSFRLSEEDITSRDLAYNPISTNSNAFAHTLLKNANLNPPNPWPLAWAPGWDLNL